MKAKTMDESQIVSMLAKAAAAAQAAIGRKGQKATDKPSRQQLIHDFGPAVSSVDASYEVSTLDYTAGRCPSWNALHQNLSDQPRLSAVHHSIVRLEADHAARTTP